MAETAATARRAGRAARRASDSLARARWRAPTSARSSARSPSSSCSRYFARTVNWLGDLGDRSQWTDQAAQYGIVAVPVALLMIGGEFDLSAGVMIGSSGLLLGFLTTRAALNIWPAIVLVLLFGAGDRLHQRLHGRQDEAAELHRHARRRSSSSRASTPAARSRSPAPIAIKDIDSAQRASTRRAPFFASTVWSPYDFKVKVIWWIGLTVVGRLAARAHALRQLDLRRRAAIPMAARNVGVPVARTKIALFMMTSDDRGAARDHRRRSSCARCRPTRASGASSSSSSRPSSAAAC